MCSRVKVAVLLTLMGLVICGTILTSCTAGASSHTAARDSRANLALASFVGQWHVHGASMTINADGTGGTTWNAGPCDGPSLDPNPLWCTGYDDLAFMGNADGTITGKVTKVWYTTTDGTPAPADYDPGAEADRVGDLFTLRHVKAGLLITTWLNRPDIEAGIAAGGNAYWCAADYSGMECGA